jgi:uncharacterized iron-regulated membrane protein
MIRSGRSLWFQVHKWLGLALLAVLIPLGLTGSLLVWHDWTDGVVNPQRYAFSTEGGRLSVEDYIRSARSVLAPGERVASLELPAEADKPILLSAAPAPERGAAAMPGPPRRHQVWLDPATGRILDDADSRAGVMRALHMFHGSLMIPGVGRTIVGWLGVAMLLSSLTGIWLWRPAIGGWLGGLRWRRGPGLSDNLHHQIGIWIAVPLAILSFTGAYISFPKFFGAIERGFTSAPARDTAPNRRAAPIETPASSPDAVIAAARSGRAGEIVLLRWPVEGASEWTVSVNDRGRTTELKVSDADRTVTPSPVTAGLARAMRQLHDGHGYNAFWQTIVFLGGLAPAVLGVTGVIMWLRARNRRSAAPRNAIRSPA